MEQDEFYRILSSYFTTLKYKGVATNIQTDLTLIISFIDKLLFGKYQELITEEDYNLISKLLYSLYGIDCLISYPCYKQGVETLSKKIPQRYRISEINKIFRVDELNKNLRI